MRPNPERRAGGAGRVVRAATVAVMVLLALLAAADATAQQLPDDFLSSVQKMEESGGAGIWAEWDRQAEKAEAAITSGKGAPETVTTIRANLEAQKANAKAMSDAATTEVARLTREQEALGPPPEDGEKEAVDVAKLRGELTRRLRGARALQVRADRVITRADELIARLTGVAQRHFFDQMTTLGPSPANPANWFAAVEAGQAVFARLGAEVARNFDDPNAIGGLRERAPIAIVAFLFAGMIGFGLRGLVLALMRRAADNTGGRARRLLIGIGAALARFITLLLIAAALLVGVVSLGLFDVVGEAMLKGVSSGLGQFIAIFAMAAAFFSPDSAPMRLAALDNRAALTGYRAALLIGASLLIDATLTGPQAVLKTQADASAVATFTAILIGSIGLWRLASVAGRPASADAEPTSYHLARALRRMILAVALSAPLLALIGYEFAARFIFFPFVHSLVLIGVGYLIFRVAGEAVDIRLGTDDPSTGPTDAEDDESGEEPVAAGQPLRLIPIFVVFVLICVGTPLLALLWGASTADLASAYRRMADGVVVGEIAISPVDFVVFALIFIIGYMMTRALQRILRYSILPKTGMSTGGVEALVSGLGYVGVMIAVVVAISSAGIDLSSLALVIGALGVGVGLGLQNIVGNFVSGIVLLIERPIKVGDWIEVGGIHGTVRKVNVRSTVIDTFDRSSYILPNSDLVSGAVTNYTLSDKIGRVVVPVGVARDSDTRQVERILLEVGRGHRMVMSYPAPIVYFLRFGENTLEFDLRVMIRDVNWIFSVRSELNHQVNARFREAGIEISFPQRDLHIRNIGPLEAALAGSGSTRAPEPPRGPDGEADDAVGGGGEGDRNAG